MQAAGHTISVTDWVREGMLLVSIIYSMMFQKNVFSSVIQYFATHPSPLSRILKNAAYVRHKAAGQ